ncbi:hypothetical protein V2J09_023712 [Rumex salicifolius]
MENGAIDETKSITIKGIVSLIMSHLDHDNPKHPISLGIGDPTAYSCFTTTPVAGAAVSDAVLSSEFNGYAPTIGLPQTRKAIADYLSRDLPYRLSADDVFVTSGCTQAIDVALSNLARPGANILLPRPGFPIYELCASFRNLEPRHFDLIPERGWELDLDAVESLADDKTVAIVIINPGNPCGNVYSYHHLHKIAETAKKLGILVIADEVYGHLTFGSNPFIPMGVFGSTAPVLTLGSLSKRWLVPGWRLGWFVITDPNATFKKPKMIEALKRSLDIYGGPATFIQAAVPRILEQNDKIFFRKTLSLLKQSSDICFEMIKEIPCLTCIHKPQGSMTVMVRLNLYMLRDIRDDIDFCFKVAKEESVILLPGIAVGLKNWVRITFAVEPSALKEALGRVKLFYRRHLSKLNFHFYFIGKECLYKTSFNKESIFFKVD